MRIFLAAWRDIEHPAAGGAEVYTDRLLSAWAKQGHEVTLVSGGSSRLPDCTLINGYQVRRVGNRLSVYRQTRSLLKELGASADLLVEEVNTIPYRILPPLGCPLGALVFQTCEDIWPHIAPWPVSSVGRSVLEPRWMRHFRDVPTVTISESSQLDLERMGLRRVAHVPMGRDTRAVQASSMKFDRPTVIHVGRLVSYKRVDHIIDASREFPDFFPGFRLLIVGDGPERSRLERLAPGYVEFVGRVSSEERDRLLRLSHLQVVTSVREGWGLIVTEAAELGTPTLAYNVSGLRDSTSAAGGWLCPPNVAALRRWLPWALENALRGDFRLSNDLGCVPWTVVADRALAHYLN